jgi:hypothetical protein
VGAVETLLPLLDHAAPSTQLLVRGTEFELPLSFSVELLSASELAFAGVPTGWISVSELMRYRPVGGSWEAAEGASGATRRATLTTSEVLGVPVLMI